MFNAVDNFRLKLNTCTFLIIMSNLIIREF